MCWTLAEEVIPSHHDLTRASPPAKEAGFGAGVWGGRDYSQSFLDHNVNNRTPGHPSWGSGDLNTTEPTPQSLDLTSQMSVRLSPGTHPLCFGEFLLGGYKQACMLQLKPHFLLLSLWFSLSQKGQEREWAPTY